MADSDAKTPVNTRPIVLRITPELHEAVKAKAAQEERTMAQLVRRALKQYVEPVQVFTERFDGPVTFGPVERAEGEIVDAAVELAEQIAERLPTTKEQSAEAVGQAMRVEPKAVVGGLKAGVAALKGTPEKCTHPVNRRIGKGCGACGEAVK